MKLDSPQGYPAGLLPSHSLPFPDLLPPTTRINSDLEHRVSSGQCQVGCPWRLHLYAAGWPFILAETCSLYCGRSGSFRCSPPRLTATQLLQVLLRPSAPRGRVSHPGRVRCSAAHCARLPFAALSCLPCRVHLHPKDILRNGPGRS